MNIRFYYITVFLFLFCWTSLSGQNANPFDVIHKGDSTAEPTIELAEVEPVVTPEKDSVVVPLPVVEESFQTELSNIFDVDHIPLKAPEKKPMPPKEEPVVAIEKEDVEEVLPVPETDDNKAPEVFPEKENIKTPIIPIKDFSRNLIFVVLILTLLILTIVINIKRKTFVNLYRSIFNDNYLNLVQREENNGTSMFFVLLYVAFFLNAAVFVHLSFMERGMSGISIFFILLVILGIYFSRHIVMRMIAAIFPFRKTALQFNFTIIVFNSIIGIILFPLNAFYAYSPVSKIMFFLGISIFIFFYLVRQLRGFFLAMRISGLNLFHFFIYLCTCEIAPFLIIIKFISDYNSAI